ncbi:MAG: adenosylcobinamide-GDP ribazoletransferase [Synergistaceae bacterium]|nr:adenosylcobinamide-GDP ribazoletransferase [Synergistaceae bacterium]
MLRAFLIACSFFTILPTPGLKGHEEWHERAMYYFALAMPLVGFIIGLIWALCFAVILKLNFNFVLKGVLMELMAFMITGGIHMDGLMDTCDAIFSRKDRETRLNILHDTHTGAFAVMGCVFIILLKSALFAEIFYRLNNLNFNLIAALICTPLFARLGMAIYFNSMPYAKRGITTSLGEQRDRKHSIYLIILACVIAALNIYLGNYALPLAWLIIFLLWRFICFNIFGGIAGDLLGAFAELSESILILSIAAGI